MSYVFHAQHHFETPSSDQHIATIPFLNASNEVLIIIDYLGPSFLKTAFQRTRSDIAGNISTIKNKYNMDPVKFHSLNALLHEEMEAQCSEATVALLWLKRALEFLYHFSILLLKDRMSKEENNYQFKDKANVDEMNGSQMNGDYTEESEQQDEEYTAMSTITLEAYELSLKPFHSYLLQGLFYVVAHVLPSKEDFLRLLAGGDFSKEKEAVQELSEFTKGLKPNLSIVNNIYISMGRNDEY